MPFAIQGGCVAAGTLKVGDFCIPDALEMVGRGAPRKPLPCRVESVGRTCVMLKEIFGQTFGLPKEAPCRLLAGDADAKALAKEIR